MYLPSPITRRVEDSARESSERQGRADRFAMPPKKASAALKSSKKRPHEAPTKGRKVFSGSRQKVARGGGGGGRRDGADDAGEEPETTTT